MKMSDKQKLDAIKGLIVGVFMVLFLWAWLPTVLIVGFWRLVAMYLSLIFLDAAITVAKRP
jgi:hypothetical protein